ncbi:MAG TPA: hypothetical protein VJB57_21070 [Dehalococcoidia bacterium]|nr:hypothetical protein [Dehalococcoidia bacterium]
MIATTHRLKSDLRVFGKDLTEVIRAGALLAQGFAFVSLVHTRFPMQRAASARASVAVVLLDAPCSAAEVAAVVERSGTVILVLDGFVEPEIEPLGATVLARDDVTLLQAVVASALAQASLTRTAY